MALRGAHELGVAPPRGALRLAGARFVLLVLGSLPAALFVSGAATSGPATLPFFTAAPRPLPLPVLISLFGKLGGSFAGGLAIGLVAVLLIHELLTAAALLILDPQRADGRPVRVLATVFRDGLTQLWPLLRVAALTVAFAAAGAAIVQGVASRLIRHGTPAGWTADTTRIVIPVIALSVFLAYMLVIGAWALWCRTFVVADGRRRVRRAAWLALRTLLRHPFRAVLPFVLLAVVTQGAGKLAVWTWLQSEPVGAVGVTGWTLLSLLLLLVQSIAWVAVLRAALRLMGSGHLGDLRAQPDTPFAIVRRLIARLRGRRAVVSAVTAAD